MSAWTINSHSAGAARSSSGSSRVRRLCLLPALLCVVGSSWAQLQAARVMAASGTVKAIDTRGVERVLEKGGPVYSGDKVVTAEGALVQMRLNDGGYLSIRPGTEMVIDRFVFDEKDASKSNFLVSLVRGGFRSITGLIGRTNPNAYQIRTSTATVGIRGTDHEPMVIPNQPGMAGLGAPGLYDKVNDGETFIRNKSGVLNLKRGDVGFASLTAGQAPQTLPSIPAFYKMELKVDAREASDGASAKPESNAPATAAPAAADTLRPSTAARREALREAQNLARPEAGSASTSTTLTQPTPTPGNTSSLPLGTRLAPAGMQTEVLQPKSTAPTNVLAPTTTRIAPSTTLTAPTTTQIAPSTTLTAPTTTQIAPSTTLIAPTTTQIAPSTTLIAPTTTQIAPSTTLVAPTTTQIAPSTTTQIAPSTTLTSPKTTINSTILLK